MTGHKSPDVDTVCSAIAYATLLQKLGYDAVPVVLGSMSKEIEYVLTSAGAETPMLLENASGLNVFLVDHADYSQSADGIESANICGVIDNHNTGSITTGHSIIYDARPIGATATIVVMRYRNYGVEIDEKTAYLLAGAIISETMNLGSKTTTSADREALKMLVDIAGIKDKDALYREMYKKSISYEGMTDEEIFFSDYKEYECAGKKYAIGCISVYDETAAADMARRMKAILPQMRVSKGVDMTFAQISIFHDGISMTFIVPSDDAAADVIVSAFGDTPVYDGASFKFNPGMSRKQVVVPAITGVLEAKD